MPRPKGLPKTGGRKKGSVNKVPNEVQALARQYTPAALQELGRLSTQAESEQARVAACREILDRGYGKPAQAVTGPDGESLTVPGTVVFIIGQAAGAENRT